MNISPFPLPSCLSTVIHFRVPTVEDAIEFSVFNSEFEEQVTTQYLNQMQDVEKQGGLKDSALWTGEDRRTALWWIYIETHEDTSTTVSYECQLCKEEHFVDIDLASLHERSTVLQSRPSATISFHAKNKKIKGAKLAPINGRAAEALELIRVERDMHEEGTVEYRKLDMRMMLHEMAYVLSLPNEPKDETEAFEARLDMLKGMAVDTEFRSLAAKTEIEMRDMRHGLLTQYRDGRYMLVTERPNCEKQKEGGSSVLLLPFRSHDFIPNL